MKGGYKKALLAGTGLIGTYLAARAVAKKKNEDKSIDEDNPYLNAYASNERSERIYERRVKPILDQAFSFGGLLMLSPLFGLISFAIIIDDPGPVFFTQKRVGKNKTYFLCHKFRSMRTSTPHDIPTHMLLDSDQYITRVGKVLRRNSLDELPQLWDIFRGRMSIIGPRPALWNQDDLVAEREKWNANDVMPGLTGWAQTNGRDELGIEEKAKLDGEYVQKISIWMDIKCFFDTIKSVLKHEGIVEGGT